MSNPNKKYLTEEVVNELEKIGILEQRQRSIEELDAIDFIQRILSDLYDEHISQYKTLKKKIQDKLDKKIDELIEKVQNEKMIIKEKLKTASGEEAQRLTKILDEYENMDTKNELEEIIDGMIEDEHARDMSFIDFIVKDY